MVAFQREVHCLLQRDQELTKIIPEMADKVEEIDIVTQLTYEKYCDNWKGSWMTEMSGKLSMTSYKPTIEGIKGVYFSGHRMMPPDCLPSALMTARNAVQALCKDTKTIFISE